MDIGNDIKLPILNIGLEYLLSCFDFFDFPHLLLYKITWRGGGDEFNLTTFNHKKNHDVRSIFLRIRIFHL